jgi:hypothetical protein
MNRGAASFLIAAFLCAVPVFGQSNTGTIKGRVHLTGELPGNPLIRMGMDPMCAKMAAGKQIVQYLVAADIKGNLANVFVSLKGSFPLTPIPTQPVKITQQGCMYSPRVVGMRLGQTLQVGNDDPLLHNVHSVSAGANTFNTSIGISGGAFTYKPKEEEIMFRLACDVHRWMIAYVGVVSNPYFTVTGSTGTFEIPNVPAGTYTIQAWQEQYGPVMKPVKVTAGGVTTVDFVYTGKEKAGTGRKL